MNHIFTKSFWQGKDVELYIGKLLRYGMLFSSVITVIGGIIYLFQHSGEVPNFTKYVGTPEYLTNIKTIIPQVFKLDGLAIIQLGVAILIFTPIMRIIFSVFSFAIKKDYLYVVITCIVLLIILLNLFFGIEG